MKTMNLSPADESLLRALSAPRDQIRWSETLDAGKYVAARAA